MAYNEVAASNQESVLHHDRRVDKDRRKGTFGPKLKVAKGKEVRIIHSNDPAFAAKIRPKKTSKPLYKRD